MSLLELPQHTEDGSAIVLDIRNMREEYNEKFVAPDVSNVDANPFKQFKKWFDDAVLYNIEEPNAMSLATCGRDGFPSVRFVLLKEVDERGFVFFTNYASAKGQQLTENPNAGLAFHWRRDGMHRQVRVDGAVERISAAESDTYFNSRPLLSRVGAVASKQSSVIASRDELEQAVERVREEYGDDVPRPENWGGYRVIPRRVEFWQGSPSRLHDRIEYTRTDLDSAEWDIHRLSP